MCDWLPQKFDVQTSYKPSNVIFVVNIKFPRATYHTRVPSTEELSCLIGSENMHWYLSVDIICSDKRTVKSEVPEKLKTLRTNDKYPCIFLRREKSYCINYPSKIFVESCACTKKDVDFFFATNILISSSV